VFGGFVAWPSRNPPACDDELEFIVCVAKQHSWKNVTRNDRKSRVVAEIHVRVGNPFMWHRPGSMRHVRAARKHRVDIFQCGLALCAGDVANAQLPAFNDSAWTSVGLPPTPQNLSLLKARPLISE